MNEPEDCRWHEGDEPLGADYQYDQGCPNCGRAYDTRHCLHCGGLFLDWWSPGLAFHDVFVYPRVDSCGDMACSRCIGRIEKEIAEEDGSDPLGFDEEPGL